VVTLPLFAAAAGNVTGLNGTIYAYDPVGTMTIKTGEQGTACTFRIAYGKPAVFTSATAPVGIITAADLLNVLAALDEARAAKYVYAGVPAGATRTILAQYILQLRAALD
jgi:hypothetical protein